MSRSYKWNQHMIDIYQHLKLNNLQLNQIYKEFFRIKVLMMLTEKLNISWHIFNGCEYRYICLFYHCYGNIINRLVFLFSGGKDTKFNVIHDHIMISTYVNHNNCYLSCKFHLKKSPCYFYKSNK